MTALSKAWPDGFMRVRVLWGALSVVGLGLWYLVTLRSLILAARKSCLSPCCRSLAARRFDPTPATARRRDVMLLSVAGSCSSCG